MSGMTWSRPELSEETRRQQFALVEWLGLAPDEVAGVSWTVTQTKQERRGWTPVEVPPEPVAVVEFSTLPGVKPSRWTHSASSSESSWTRWRLVLPVRDLAEVLGMQQT